MSVRHSDPQRPAHPHRLMQRPFSKPQKTAINLAGAGMKDLDTETPRKVRKDGRN